MLKESSAVKPDRWQSEKCGQVQNESSNAINECRQSVAMVFVSKLLAVCPTLVLVLFGYCVGISGEGKDLPLPAVFRYFETKYPQTCQKPEIWNIKVKVKSKREGSRRLRRPSFMTIGT